MTMKRAGIWKKVRPESPGIYKVRGFHLGRPEAYAVVEVRIVDDELRSNLHERNSDHKTEDWSAISNHSENFEWLKLA